MVRGHLTRTVYVPKLERRHSAILMLQAYSRGYLQRKQFKIDLERARRSAVVIQSGKRGLKMVGMGGGGISNEKKIYYNLLYISVDQN